MTHAPVRSLRDLRISDTAEVGGKAANLGEMLAAGIHVPDGVVMTAEGARLPPDQRKSLLEGAVRELGNGSFAVRSSGITEDGAERSFAGMYESVLDVPAEGLAEAADRTLASAGDGRVGSYAPAGADPGLAVIVQRMVHATAAGVALTADPITGNRQRTIVTAVKGTGDRLVSGDTIGDEWVVEDGRATARRQTESAIDARQAAAVATQARQIAAGRGAPQDIEWAFDASGALWILQTRPMTALPPEVSWASPAPGAYTRQLRLGEWIGAPVTPLFESWLLTAMEGRMHELFQRYIGQRASQPLHVLVNGWYFYSINWVSPGAMVRNLPGMLSHVIREPKRMAGILPSTARHSVPYFEHDWRTDLQPRYRALAAEAAVAVESLPVGELPALVDRLAVAAGEYFVSIAALSGAAYKLEMVLAGFYRRHLQPVLGGSHLPLLTGIAEPAPPSDHAVTSLDWWYPPLGGNAAATSGGHDRLVAERLAAEAAAEAALASSPKLLEKFRERLALSQHLIPIREEQTAELTLPWPIMRRAVLRIAAELVGGGALTDPDDVFFLTHDEVFSALDDPGGVTAPDLAARRALRDRQARLVPPLLIGKPNPMFKRLWDGYPRILGAEPSERALVSGSPASGGRATGQVRVIHGPEDFDLLQPGEILVAPLTAPAWTPLFTRAVAVVTDVGSPASHASIIAREYGIPAVVGTGDATARLTNGMRVTVDGTTGNVEPA